MATPVDITFGFIEPDDELGNYEPQAKGTVTTDYMIHNHYEQDRQSYAASLTSPLGFKGKTTGIVRLGNPVMIWICEWTALRVGDVPLVPDPEGVKAEWTLLDVSVTPTQLTVAPDGVSGVYRVSGVYVYVNENPDSNVYKEAVFPQAPWVKKESGLTRKIPLTNLAKWISNPDVGRGVLPPGGPVV